MAALEEHVDMSSKALRNLIILALVTAVAVWIWWETRPKPITVVVAVVERGKVEKTVANTRAGTVKACRRTRLSPSLGGQVARLPVVKGSRVKKGDLLLELWNRDVAAEVDLAARESDASKATGRAACLKAAQARREAERLRSLSKKKLVSDEDLDRAETEAKASAADCNAALASAEVSVARHQVAQATLEKTRLYAPFSGVVAEINGELNEYVTPSPPGIATLPIVDLIENNCFYVAAPIDEVDVAGVEVGQPARITLDAFGKQARKLFIKGVERSVVKFFCI